MGKILSEKKNNVRTLLLVVVGGVYIAVGAAVFSSIERGEEVTRMEQLFKEEEEFKSLYNISDEVFRGLTTLVMELEPHKSGVQWGFVGALYFAITVVTTIGYGHSVPRTAAGKIFCMVYAMVGIPLYLVLVQAMGERINHAAKFCLKVVGRRLGFKFKEVSHKCLIPFGILSCCLTIVVGASSFAYFEQWKYLDSVYYCVMTLSTIGFGDYVALQTNNALETDHQYVAFSLVYIMIGLAVIGAFLNLVILRMMVTLPDTPEGSQKGEEDKVSDVYSGGSWDTEGPSSSKWKTFLRWGEEKSEGDLSSDDGKTTQPLPKYFLSKRHRSPLRHICCSDVTMNGHCCGRPCAFKPTNATSSACRCHGSNDLKIEDDVTPKPPTNQVAPAIEVTRSGGKSPESPPSALPLSTSLLKNPWDSQRSRYLSGDSGYSGLGSSRTRLSSSPVWTNSIAESTTPEEVTSSAVAEVTSLPVRNVVFLTSSQSDDAMTKSDFLAMTSPRENNQAESPPGKSNYDVTKRKSRCTSPLALQGGDCPLVVFKKDTAQGGSVTMVREKNDVTTAASTSTTAHDVIKSGRRSPRRSPLIRQKVYPPFRPCITVTSSEDKSLTHQDSNETTVTALTTSDGDIDDVMKKQLSPETVHMPVTSSNSIEKKFNFDRKVIEYFSRSEEMTSLYDDVTESLNVPDVRPRSRSEPTFDVCNHCVTSSSESGDDITKRDSCRFFERDFAASRSRKRKKLKTVRSRMSGLKSSFIQPRGGSKEQPMSPLNPRSWISWFYLLQSKRATSSSDGVKVKFSPITPRASILSNSSSDEAVTSLRKLRHRLENCPHVKVRRPDKRTRSHDMTSCRDVSGRCRDVTNCKHLALQAEKYFVCHKCKKSPKERSTI